MGSFTYIGVMKILTGTFALALGVLLGACGGTTSPPVAAPTSTTGAAANTLDSKSYEVTVDFPGEKPVSDTLSFTGGKFESTACTTRGFPKSTEYTTAQTADGPQFEVTTRHPNGTSVEWKGAVKGDAVEGTAVRTMNGKTDKGTFKGAIKK